MKNFFFLTAVLSVLSACGSSATEKKTSDCNDGQVQSCSCDDGADGSQICRNGSYDACICQEQKESCDDNSDCDTGTLCVDAECVADTDGDGFADTSDNCPTVRNPNQADQDGNDVGDACEDADSDGITDIEDNCPNDSNREQNDQDRDGLGDVCDSDRDGDNVSNDTDNCPIDANPDQQDSNSDGIGDRCDGDQDAVLDVVDNCPNAANPNQADLDGDGQGDACDIDRDGDGADNDADVCPDIPDDQTNTDGDADGDACDDDDDNDGKLDASDNCPLAANTLQQDRDNNGVGDACQDDDNDGFVDAVDNCPDEANPDQRFVDTDSDSIADCIERSLGTDPTDADSDGDGLTDGEEVAAGYDPTDADTDNDGVEDGTEVELGLNPLLVSSFNDGINDGNRPIVTRCANSATRAVNAFTNAAAGWSLALPNRFVSTTNLSIQDPGNIQPVGSFFSDFSTNTAGVVIGYNSPVSSVVVAWIRSLTGQRPTTFTTHDGHTAYSVVGSDPPALTSTTLTGRVFELAALAAPFPRANFLNEPTHHPGALGTPYINFTVIDRGTSTVLMIAGAANTPSDQIASELTSATSTTNLAPSGTLFSDDCTAQFGQPQQKVDIYWVMDHSGSMGDDYGRLSAVVPNFFNALSAADVRHAMTTMQLSDQNRPRGNWFTTQSQFQTALNGVQVGGFAEHGLTIAEADLRYVTDPATPAQFRARPDAELITVVMTDEEAQSIQDDPLSTSAGQAILSGFLQYFPTVTTMHGLLGTSTCSSDGAAYRAVIAATGGTDESLCDADIQAFLVNIVRNAIISPYVLTEIPITTTIRVFVDGVEVPASATNGWQYDPSRNGVVLTGFYSPQPPNAATMFGGNDVAVTYQTWLP